MLEVIVLKYLLYRGNFNKYYPYLRKLAIEPELKKLFKLLPIFFDNSDQDNCSLAELKALFTIEYQNIKDPELYVDLFNQTEKANIGDSVVDRMIKKLIYKDVNNKIIQECMPALSGVDKKDTIEGVKALIDGYEQLILPDDLNKEDDLFITDDIEALVEEQINTPGLSWPLACIQKDIGDLRGGTLGHVFAEVEMGKTTFVLSVMNHWRKCLLEDEIGIYICNEEAGKRLQLRWYGAVLQWPEQAIIEQKERAKAGFYKRGGNKVKLLYRPGITNLQILDIVKRFKPRFLAVDQGDNVLTPQYKEANETARLGRLYKDFRILSSDYGCDIITVGQSADITMGKNLVGRRYLKKNMMNNSKVEKPAAMDYIIGIGSDADQPAIDLRRYISIPKNKVGPCGHGRYVTMMEPDKARYVDV